MSAGTPGPSSWMPPTPGARQKGSGSDSPGAVDPRDPPRPAREGKEWVWYPEGYWAERDIRDPSAGYQHHQSTDSSKPWKWRSGSPKGKQSTDEQRTSSVSPRSVLQSQLNPAFLSPVPASPYVSESAQVFSLQYPEGDKEAKGNGNGGSKDGMKNTKRPSPSTFNPILALNWRPSRTRLSVQEQASYPTPGKNSARSCERTRG